MTTHIDYSLPVGWWCPVCDCGMEACECGPYTPLIPRYLPIPEGQRPPAASEVEEAEVVTAQDFGSNLGAGYCVMADVSACIAQTAHGGPEFFYARAYYWPVTGATPTEHINDIAQASARARTDSQHVTGATE